MKISVKRKKTLGKKKHLVSKKNRDTGVSNLWKKLKSRMTSDEIDEQMRKLRSEWG